MIRFFLSVLIFAAAAAPAHALTVDLWNAFERDVLTLVNQDRTSQGLGTLTGESRLHNAARAHSGDMAANNFFSHTGTGGTNAGNRIQTAGYSFTAWGENIAAGYRTAESVVTAWLNSPGHRDNMRNGIFTDVGIGYIEGGDQADFSTYWTLVLAAGDGAQMVVPPIAQLTQTISAALADDVNSPTPMPLPASIWMFITALMSGVALVRRRRNAAVVA